MARATESTGPDFAIGIAMSDLSESTPLLGHAHGNAVVLIRQGANVHALGAKCSHYGGPLAQGLVVGESIRCPSASRVLRLRTGEAVGAPGLNPIACYEVQRRGDRVIVGSKQSLQPGKPPPKSPPPLSSSGPALLALQRRTPSTPRLQRSDHADRR